MNYQGWYPRLNPMNGFLNPFIDPLFDILPNGIDVCYDLLVQPDVIGVTLYVYDSTSPLNIT